MPSSTQWTSDHEGGSGESAPFHIATQGACVIDLVGSGRSIVLFASDVVVLPRGARHVVRGVQAPASLAETQTDLVCGHLTFERAHQNLVLALPEAIVIATSDGTDAARAR